MNITAYKYRYILKKVTIMYLRIILFSLLFSIFVFEATEAYDEPFVNLGQTSFLDGGVPAGPGAYFSDYFFYYNANKLKDDKGKELPLPETGYEATVNLFQFIYLSKVKVFGAGLGLDLVQPWILASNIKDGLHNEVLSAQNGLGDTFVGLFLQFDPVMNCKKQPRFVHRFELQVLCPTGRYSHYKSVNPGSNFWSINPYWAFTAWFNPKLSASMRLHYLWNAKNHHPNIAFGPNRKYTQAGQAIHSNFSLSYEATKLCHLGINGYFFKQITNTKLNGEEILGRKESVWAIGPGMLLSFSKDHNLFFNSYFEQNGKNRPQGNLYQVRYVYHF